MTLPNMPTLSIQMPWAWLILAGHKDIENRTWYPPGTRIGQRIRIHAGKKRDDEGLREAAEVFEWTVDYGTDEQAALARPALAAAEKALARPVRAAEHGALLGEATLSKVVTGNAKPKSPWFFGPYGLVFTDPKLYPEPIPYRGRLGFFYSEIP